jgi:hypothetical protein
MDKKNDINSKTSPIQMREFMKRMRTGTYTPTVTESLKDLSARDMLKITRNIHEGKVSLNEEQDIENKKTPYDQNMEEEKFRNFFNDMNVSIKLIDLGVYDKLVFWGGTIDGVIQFVYKVTPDESTSGVEFNYLEDFSPDNPQNEEITGRIESYFNTFYKYWRDNVLDGQDGGNDEEQPQDEPVIKMNSNPEQDQEQEVE